MREGGGGDVEGVDGRLMTRHFTLTAESQQLVLLRRLQGVRELGQRGSGEGYRGMRRRGMKRKNEAWTGDKNGEEKEYRKGNVKKIRTHVLNIAKISPDK